MKKAIKMIAIKAAIMKIKAFRLPNMPVLLKL